MQYKFTIDGDFITYLDFSRLDREDCYLASKIRQHETDRARSAAGAQAPLPPGLYDVTFVWYVRDVRSVPEDIAFACRFIFRGLQKSGYIGNDPWDWIHDITHEFATDRRPRVVVTFESVEELTNGTNPGNSRSG